LIAEHPVEVGRIREHKVGMREARFAAEVEPGVGRFGQVAGLDVMPDLVEFRGRQRDPSLWDNAPGPVEIRVAVFALGERRLVNEEDSPVAGNTADFADET
jgi:hypothetical protein